MNEHVVTGDLAEQLFICRGLSLGWEVSKPLNSSRPYDLLIRRLDSTLWETVQVKCAFTIKTPTGPAKECELRVGNRGGTTKQRRLYQTGDFDQLAIIDGESIVLIPHHVIAGKGRIRIKNWQNSTYAQYVL